MFSRPTSSVIQAWYAPLVNVYEMPQKAHSTITAHGSETTATSAHAVPIPR